MKKSILVLILSIVFILAACGNQSNNSQSDSKSEKNESKDTVKIENNYEAQGKEKDGSDAKRLKKRSKFLKT